MTASATLNSLNGQVEQVLIDAFAASGLPAAMAKVTRTSRSELGDLQCNGAMALGRSLGRSPRELAEQVATHLRNNADFAAVDVAGPGFINLRLSDGALARCAQAQLKAARGGIAAQPVGTVVLDFGGPNVAKPLHVGHLRSLVIGESLRRIFLALGQRTIADVHLGDWGLQMGMLIAEIRRRWPGLGYFHAGAAVDSSLPFGMADLQRLYPEAAAACKLEPARMQEAREATAALQAGEPGHLALWQAIRGLSLEAQRRDIDRLDVHFDLWLGESDVQSLIAPMIGDLVARGIATRSEGAWVIEVAEATDSKPMPPLLLAKSDGAALYATTDLATLLERSRRYAQARVIYVVDQRQALHFEQVFRAARRAGWVKDMQLVHAGFGTVNGIDGKPYKTRQGGVAQLSDLLNDAVGKAHERLSGEHFGEGDGEGGSDAATLAPRQREALAAMVGLAAVKFADLSSYRTAGYVFDAERMVSFEGRTGPYVQYACVRIHSLLARAAARGFEPGRPLPVAAAERALVLDCAGFPDVVAAAAAQLAPNLLADYVFTLAQTFSRFYGECPVLAAADAEVRASRLALCELTRRILAEGLHLLGIAVPARM